MRSTHLRQADLNLLVVFTAVAEERNITRAASRLLLSQPAVTRALQRLRDTFHDDLLIRTSTGYEPTPKGQRLQQYLAPEQVAVDIIGGVQTHPGRHLAAIGEKRHCPLVVAQHTVAIRVAAVTDMIATVPRRMALLEAPKKVTKILEGPAALGSFKYVMIWHQRMQTDAAHIWLRSIIREAGKAISTK